MYNKNTIDDKQYTNESNICKKDAICLIKNDSLGNKHQIKYQTPQQSQSIIFSLLPCNKSECTSSSKFNSTDGKNMLRFKYIFYLESYDV